LHSQVRADLRLRVQPEWSKTRNFQTETGNMQTKNRERSDQNRGLAGPG
jgi:hypothetical protein